MTRGALSLDQQCRAAGLPVPEREVRFAPPRRWRFDWAFCNQLIAVEQDGATWTQGRHSRGAGYERDCEKMAEAICRGWRVFRFTTAQVNDGRALGYLERLLKGWTSDEPVGRVVPR